MSHQKQKSLSALISNVWDEFLFARKFEYETELSVSELELELSKIEQLEDKSYVISPSSLIHSLQFTQYEDKQASFMIGLETKNADKCCNLGFRLLRVDGIIRSDKHTGLTQVSGKIAFNAKYYLAFLVFIMMNITLQTYDNFILHFVWLPLIAVIWYRMYRERNKLATRLDDIIMNTKNSLKTDAISEN